jgi:hypothetical protein
MFVEDNLLSDKLNDFQNRYARYIRCQDDRTADTVNPSCSPSDSFVNVQRSYQSLLTTMQDIDHMLTTQPRDGTTNEKSEEDGDEMLRMYQTIRQQRKEMDLMLQKLYSEKQSSPETSAEQLKQSMFANTLWVILASCLVWYAVVEMK